MQDENILLLKGKTILEILRTHLLKYSTQSFNSMNLEENVNSLISFLSPFFLIPKPVTTDNQYLEIC